ncbi:hypothetical protein DA078_06840 [Lactiplantibacillus plantarum]|nr:hypothetical protein DA078_06840 [Lactiplantibacillus plantarum]
MPHGENTLSLKPEKVSELLEGFIPDNAGRVRISDEVLDSIVDQVEERMLKRSKGKPNKVVKGPDKRFKNVGKQPHVRIEIDDITDTPKVFIDGVLQQEVHHIDIGWDEEDICLNNRYRINFIDSLGNLHEIGQGK